MSDSDRKDTPNEDIRQKLNDILQKKNEKNNPKKFAKDTSGKKVVNRNFTQANKRYT